MTDVSNYPTHKQTYEPIATQTLSTAASSVTFSNIPQTFKDLILTVDTYGATTSGYPALRFNSDTGSNYSTTSFMGNGSTANSGRYSNITELYLSNYIGGFNTTVRFTSRTHIMSYSSSSVYKTVITLDENQNTEASVGLWRNTAAITTVLVRGSSNFAAGAKFSLYGIAG